MFLVRVGVAPILTWHSLFGYSEVALLSHARSMNTNPEFHVPSASTSPTTGNDDHEDDHDLGLSYDLQHLAATIRNSGSPSASGRSLALPLMDRRLQRRDFVRLAVVTGVAGTLTLGGLRRGANAQTTSAACTDIPEETAGPYPGDGTNGPNVLTTTGVVRSDLRSSFGSLSGTAAGVVLKMSLTITDSATCAPAKGYAVYLWHADQQGRYSLYSSGVTDQNYLRGVQETEANGVVTFTTVFPGCYDGRWPHMHFEVYPNLAAAGDASKRIATSQIAFPKAACESVYGTTGYSASVPNLARVSLATDGIFGDDSAGRQLAVITGSPTTGMTGALSVAVSNTVKASGGGGRSGAQPGQGGQPPQAVNTAPTTVPTTVAPTTSVAKKVTTTVKRAVTTKKKSSAKKTTTTKKK
jgi:protocatechuate 3,4-dioxygenase beta subunit